MCLLWGEVKQAQAGGRPRQVEGLTCTLSGKCHVLAGQGLVPCLCAWQA